MPRLYFAAALWAFLWIAGSVPAMAAKDDPRAVSEERSKADRDQLKTESSDLAAVLNNLHTKIDEDNQKIQTLADPKTTQKTVADLQASVSEALSGTAENGKIALLAKKVLDTEKGWLADAKAHGFSPEREAFIEENFKKIISDTELTIAGITKIRQELTETLKKLQNEQDYLEELARIDQGKEMVRVLQNLLQDMKTTSDNLNTIMHGVPGV